MAAVEPRSVLVIGQGRYALAVVRSLGRAGYRTLLGVPSGQQGSHVARSRYSVGTWTHPPTRAATAELFWDSLRTFLVTEPAVECIVPIGMLENSFFALHEAPFSIPPVAMPPRDVYLACRQKFKILELAQHEGVTVPEWTEVSCHEELRGVGQRLGYPMIVKSARDGRKVFGRKALVFDSEPGIAAVMPAWPKNHDSLIAQQFIDGVRNNLYFFAVDGRIEASLQLRVDETDRADGIGEATAGTTVARSESVMSATATIVKRLGYSGVGTAQYLVPTSGPPVFLELNPRFGGNVTVPVQAGVDLPRYLVEWSIEGSTANGSEYVPGGRFYSLLGTLVAVRRAHDDGLGMVGVIARVGNAVVSAMRARYHILWDVRDPMPALWSYGRGAGRTLRRLLRMGVVDESTSSSERPHD